MPQYGSSAEECQPGIARNIEHVARNLYTREGMGVCSSYENEMGDAMSV